MPSLTNDLRVLVVASSPLARAGLTALLDGAPGLDLVGQTAGEAELADALDVYRPDALIWDMGWEPLQTLDRLDEVGDAGGAGAGRRRSDRARSVGRPDRRGRARLAAAGCPRRYADGGASTRWGRA